MRHLALLTIAVFAASVTLWGQPAPLSGFSDQGTFLVFINEERVAGFTFQWKPDGSFENEGALEMAGQRAESKITITPDTEGRWVKIVADTPLGQRVLERNGKEVKSTYQGKSNTTNMRERVLIFENYSPALIAQALRLYDAAKGGQQIFPCRIIGGGGTDITVERGEALERQVGSEKLSLVRWKYTIGNIEIGVLAATDGRVYLADVPVQHAAMVRQGYEALRKPPEESTATDAQYEVKLQSNVQVPMRDGVKLATDIYLPTGADKAPLVLVRTPYKKEMVELTARFYARRGYAAAVQDVRGRFSSAGKWEPFVNEAKDGYDTIEWLARQPWSNGKVGMIGASYVGWVQWFAASLRPPHLVTIIPNVSPPDPFHNIPYENGVLMLSGSLWWADVLETNATADITGGALVQTFKKSKVTQLKSLPVIELDKVMLDKESPYWRNWLSHPPDDPYWADTLFLDRLKDVNIPVFHQSGWYDGDAIGTKMNYLKMASLRHANQKLTIGPWGHTDTATRTVGDWDFGSQAVIDLQRDYLRWFDYWLKGIDNGIMKEPLVNVFVMETNRWARGATYPLPETRFEKLYLASGGHANTSAGDGSLSFTAPAAAAPQDRYVYDPADPTPEPGYTTEEDPPRQAVQRARERREQALRTRQDILIYTSEPFEKSYTIAGPLTAVIYASTSARDTDWMVRLGEIDRDGKYRPLWASGTGVVRARFRQSMLKPVLLKPGEIVEYTIDLWHTAITIAPGHRLQVELASAAFPTFSRNLNTGGNNETETRFVKAEQTIYHDAAHPSHILLPRIDEPKK